MESKTRHKPTPRPRAPAPVLKSKLLDLQSLRKYAQPARHGEFALGGAASGSTSNGYDYAVFVAGSPGDSAPRSVRESQVRAWELAERVAATVIFDSDSEDESEAPTPTRNADKLSAVLAIPGYTADEVKSIVHEFESSGFESPLVSGVSRHLEPVEAYQYRQDQQLSQVASFAGKRQQQVCNKKELIRRLFGYNNNLNQEFMTNNSAYSALDNMLNIQKAFHEDKDEVRQLIECEQEYQAVMEEARFRFEHTASREDIMDHLNLRAMVSQKLDMIYNRLLHEGSDAHHEQVVSDDLARCILDRLRPQVDDEEE